MVRKGRLWICLSSLFLVAWPVSAQIRTSLKFSADETSSAKKTTFNANVKLGAVPAVLWREPSDLKTRDLFYGPGGSGHQPAGKLSFLEEKFSGAHPKFDIQDESGIRWGVKLGNEARPETAATRLVWAVGYFTNEDYYVPELKFPKRCVFPAASTSSITARSKAQG